MPRAGRTFEEGRTYHVYNRVGGGLFPFIDEELTKTFVELFRNVMKRDNHVVLAWCLLGNHYHLVIRQGAVPLSRSMKTLQQRVTRAHNLRGSVYGPLWQGRFKAKEVSDQEYLMKLVAHVHLNPITAGLAERADDYCWSGHREITGRRKPLIVAVDDVLLLFGQRRRTALRRYRAAMTIVDKSKWGSKEPGQLPWWRLGRPTEEEHLRRKDDAFIDEQGRSTARWRPRYGADEWLQIACGHLGVDRLQLSDRNRNPDIVRARELIGLMGVERFGVKVNDLAAALGKSRDGVSRWIRRGVDRRESDPEFASDAQSLDGAASEEP